MRVEILYTITICLLISTFSYGQSQERYSKFVKEAEVLYKSKNYKQSAKKYKLAFDQFDGKAYPEDRYNAACSCALAGDAENSFYNLFYLAENPNIKYKNLSRVISEPDFHTLHSHDQWTKLIGIIETNEQDFEKNLNKPLMALLDTIYQEDQKYRLQIDQIEKKYGFESDEAKAHWKIIREKDSINLMEITKILDKHGWIGSEIIGDQGNLTLFLVIQHSDLETQQKYLPMMHEAVTLGNARADNLALLEDRVALGLGKRQVYGSQIAREPETGEYYVLPLIEPEKVNERRAEVGLGTIEDYIGIWKMTWNVEAHKERTQKVESEKKK